MEVKIIKRIELSEEEKIAWNNIKDNLVNLTCSSIKCEDCPLFIETTEKYPFNCIINILTNTIGE